jgi:hypothetical protein
MSFVLSAISPADCSPGQQTGRARRAAARSWPSKQAGIALRLAKLSQKYHAHRILNFNCGVEPCGERHAGLAFRAARGRVACPCR